MKGSRHLKPFMSVTLLLLFSTNLFSQVKFETGYFITNDGRKMECLIRNFDLRNNPHSFAYKRTETDSLSAEIRYLSAKEIFANQTGFGSSFKRIGLLLTYRILKFGNQH